MVTKDLRKLLSRLNNYNTRMLEAGAGFCIARGHYEVSLEHLLLKMLEDGSGDITKIMDHYGIPKNNLWVVLQHRLENFKSGNTGRPSFSPIMMSLFESAWIVGSVHHGASEIRSGHIIEALVGSDGLRMEGYVEALSPVNLDDLRAKFADIVSGSSEDTPAARKQALSGDIGGTDQQEGETALDLYTTNVTQKARDGKIDPIFGRDQEIRQAIDILSRRRKNNPILVGEAGVGKTAIVEGLALRIVEGDVPDSMKDNEICSLDLALLQAGAGVKGEFENRLKNVIEELKTSAKPIILFIDEAHTLIGAGGSAGTGDAANLLKPALARGELRTIAATTFSEFKQYIEKDPALERRFQPIKIEEPDAEKASMMLRGIKGIYEKFHGLQISNEAARASAELSQRYISGRQLPDKAVDLLDTASARVKMGQTTKPAQLDDVERKILNVEVELQATKRDIATGLHNDFDKLKTLTTELGELATLKDAFAARWKTELGLVIQIKDLRGKIANNEGDILAHRQEVDRLATELKAVQGEDPLIHAEVNPAVVAQVIADWTGIPVGSMMKDEAKTLLDLDAKMKKHIKGQDEALTDVCDSIRTAKAGMKDPNAPIAVFLFVGPSGTGKTETARMIAEEMFGGEKFLTTINMSEYQESHTVSQLKGAPPGYVGYGEGGILTEAVRQRPYSVVLLDEVEKAHRDVMNLFYQVFDKGFMRDGEGREIDFKNTIIIMTSNIGSEKLTEMGRAETRPEPDEMREAIHHDLIRFFQAALLARMKTIPYYPLLKDAMTMITRLKLRRIGKRLSASHQMVFTYTDEVVDKIVDRCTTIDSGARNIDFIIDRTVLPEASRALLLKMVDGDMPQTLELGIDNEGYFTYSFDGVQIEIQRKPPKAEKPKAEPEPAPEAAEEPEAKPKKKKKTDDA
jgi:type VI secretion system protein VasG